jgi:hypothetical protein
MLGVSQLSKEAISHCDRSEFYWNWPVACKQPVNEEPVVMIGTRHPITEVVVDPLNPQIYIDVDYTEGMTEDEFLAAYREARKEALHKLEETSRS